MIELNIKSPQETLFAGKCNAINLPGNEGQFQLLNNHCCIMAQLKAGIVTIATSEGRKDVPIKGGFLSFENNVASLLAD